MKGLTVSIFTHSAPNAYPRHNWSGGGHLLGHCFEAVVVGYLDEDGDLVTLPEDSQVFDAAPDRPPVVLKRHVGHVIAEAFTLDPSGPRTMSGGAFISSSDSRFSALVEGLLGREFYGAIPLHDRYEC